MKTFINKTFLAVVATVLVAGTAFFASCEKEEPNSVSTTNISKKAKAFSKMILASALLCVLSLFLVTFL